MDREKGGLDLKGLAAVMGYNHEGYFFLKVGTEKMEHGINLSWEYSGGWAGPFSSMLALNEWALFLETIKCGVHLAFKIKGPENPVNNYDLKEG
jgi:hypothetical protein